MSDGQLRSAAGQFEVSHTASEDGGRSNPTNRLTLPLLSEPAWLRCRDRAFTVQGQTGGALIRRHRRPHRLVALL